MAEDIDTAIKGPAVPVTPPPSAVQRPSLPEIPEQPTEIDKLVPRSQPLARPEPRPERTAPPSYTYRPPGPRTDKPEDLEKLLPLEDEHIEGPKNQETAPISENKQIEKTKKQISGPTKPMTDLESEIFPKPTQEQEPPVSPEAGRDELTFAEASADRQTPGPQTPPSNLPTELGLTPPEEAPSSEVKEETPEQILGMEKPSFPAAPSSTPQEFPAESEQEIAPPAPPEFAPGDSIAFPPTSVPRAPEGGFAQQPKKSIPNIALIIGALVILGAVIAGGAAFLIFGGEEITEEPSGEEPLPEPEEPGEQAVPVPQALFTPDFVQELSVRDTLESTLRGVLRSVEEGGNSYPQSSITYLPIKLPGSTQADDQFLTAQTFMSGLNLAVPEGFFDVVRPTFMLFLFGSEDGERIGCQNNLVSEASCYGPRLGLVFEAQEGRETQITAMMEQWMSLQNSQSNIDALILTDLVEIPEPVVFESVNYQSQAILNAPTIKINYANLPMPSYDGLALSSTSLDFAIQGNNILFTTSKRSMEIIIDRLLQE